MRRLIVIAALMAWGPVFGQEVPESPREALVLGPTGSPQRAVVNTDAVAGMWARGGWHPPRAGESVAAGERARTWESRVFDAEGKLRLANGEYAFATFESSADGVAMLQVVGAGAFFVNGEQRVGDPYGTGWTRLPVRLRRGANELLVRGARSDIRVSWSTPPMTVYIDDIDPTLPDLMERAPGRVRGAVLVVNATNEWVADWFLAADLGNAAVQVRSAVPVLAPLSRAKVPFEFLVPASEAATAPKVNVGLSRSPAPGAPLTHQRTFDLRIRTRSESRKETFQSDIDGSIQYYAVREALGDRTGKPAMIFTLHGASVEAIGQADAYASKDWAHIVAPTNRRPYGFDWEDWGRLDFLEVYREATKRFPYDESRVYLTGHSMGGHGTWQIGAQVPGLFAAIAPSAGWSDFWSYAGAAAYDGGTPIEGILRRAVSPSETLSLKDNYRDLGVYVLHGDADDNVPVSQARKMRKMLAEFHPDFAYYERPGAGHWWGGECVDWPPLMEFLRRHRLPDRTRQARTRFTTMTPSVSGSPSGWAIVESQIEPFKPSTVDLRVDVAKKAFSGTTSNVSRLTLGLDMFPSQESGPFNIELDGQTLDVEPARDEVLRIDRKGDRWAAADDGLHKSAARGGPFKDAFRNRVVLVVGTGGSGEENRVTLEKARLDSETFWYRGNASLEIVQDRDFDAEQYAGRNIVLYGNRDTNAAWPALMSGSPIDVARGQVRVGDRVLKGEDLACLFIRPRPGSQAASVGAVAGSGAVGMRLTAQVPYFRSGVGLPDWIVLGPEVCERGINGIRGTGFFDSGWSLSAIDSAWQVEATPASP